MHSPCTSHTQLGAFLQPPMKGVVLQTFGPGNIPTQKLLLAKLKEACDRGVVIVNCTQCAKGNVSTNYPAARVRRREEEGTTYFWRCGWWAEQR